MKFNQNKAKSGAVNMLALTAGFLATNYALNEVGSKAPENIQKFIPGGVAVATTLAPAFEIVKGDAANAALSGAALCGVIRTANQFSAPAEGAEPSQIQSVLSRVVPQLNGVAVLGNITDYSETFTNNLLNAGDYYGSGSAATIPQSSTNMISMMS